jgi:hypothetical protein
VADWTTALRSGQLICASLGALSYKSTLSKLGRIDFDEKFYIIGLMLQYENEG